MRLLPGLYLRGTLTIAMVESCAGLLEAACFPPAQGFVVNFTLAILSIHPERKKRTKYSDMQTRCANHFQIYFEPINPMDEIVLAMPWSILGVSPFFWIIIFTTCGYEAGGAAWFRSSVSENVIPGRYKFAGLRDGLPSTL
jgi:hypothetical protein